MRSRYQTKATGYQVPKLLECWDRCLRYPGLVKLWVHILYLLSVLLSTERKYIIFAKACARKPLVLTI